MKALIVCSHAAETAVLSTILERARILVKHATTPYHALNLHTDDPVDIFVVALASQAGVAAVHQLRRHSTAYIIALIEVFSDQQHLAVVEAGADLVLSQNINVRLLSAYLNGIRRLAGSVPVASVPTLKLDTLTIDAATHTIHTPLIIVVITSIHFGPRLIMGNSRLNRGCIKIQRETQISFGYAPRNLMSMMCGLSKIYGTS